MPQRKSVPLAWRRFGARYRLVGSRCTKCGRIYFPPKSMCTACGSTELEEHRLREEGRVLTFTTVHVAPAGFEHRVPYTVGIIEIENGARICGEIICERGKIKTGARVRPVFRKVYENGKDGIIHYALKWKVVE